MAVSRSLLAVGWFLAAAAIRLHCGAVESNGISSTRQTMPVASVLRSRIIRQFYVENKWYYNDVELYLYNGCRTEFYRSPYGTGISFFFHLGNETRRLALAWPMKLYCKHCKEMEWGWEGANEGTGCLHCFRLKITVRIGRGSTSAINWITCIKKQIPSEIIWKPNVSCKGFFFSTISECFTHRNDSV